MSRRCLRVDIRAVFLWVLQPSLDLVEVEGIATVQVPLPGDYSPVVVGYVITAIGQRGRVTRTTFRQPIAAPP
jgi:hypothetical protein